MPRRRRATTLLALAATVLGGCGGMDEAELVDPGTEEITAATGQLRVLRHHDDPTAGDTWLDVLEPDPTVATATGTFREADSRTPAEGEPADIRLLYEAAGPGRTVMVRLNCRGCDARGVPDTALADTGVLVWELVVDGGTERHLGDAAALPREEHRAATGDHVVVVRDPDAPSGLRVAADGDAEALVHVARHAPADGAELLVDVFAAATEGAATVTYGDGGDGDVYEVVVSDR